MSVTSSLPPRWRPEPGLKDQIPASHDWRAFGIIRTAPRYAASITGQGVYDLQERRFLSPIIPRNGRKRYRLVTSDPDSGKLDAVRVPFYSSLILALVAGERPNRKMQAHHRDHDRTNDHWSNLSWVTGKANRRMAAQNKSRKGMDNPNAKLGSNALAEFLWDYDDEMHTRRRVDLKPYAAKYEMTVDQLRRLANERSRADEVRAIRAAQRKHRDELARHEAERRRQQRGMPETNPFLD